MQLVEIIFRGGNYFYAWVQLVEIIVTSRPHIGLTTFLQDLTTQLENRKWWIERKNMITDICHNQRLCKSFQLGVKKSKLTQKTLLLVQLYQFWRKVIFCDSKFNDHWSSDHLLLSMIIDLTISSFLFIFPVFCDPMQADETGDRRYMPPNVFAGSANRSNTDHSQKVNRNTLCPLPCTQLLSVSALTFLLETPSRSLIFHKFQFRFVKEGIPSL